MKKIIFSFILSSVCLSGMSQKSQIDLPITWDDTMNVDYTVIGFGDDTAYLAPDPTNASNIVLEVIKPAGAQTWAGVVLGNDSLASAIPFSAGNTILRARVYASVVGTPIRFTFTADRTINPFDVNFRSTGNVDLRISPV